LTVERVFESYFHRRRYSNKWHRVLQPSKK